MALSQQRGWTIEDFQAFVARPENSDRLFELINGEIVEKMPGRTSNSELSYNLAFEIKSFCKTHNLPCHISGGDGAYAIQGQVVAPDFAFKTTPMSDEYPDPEPPLWVVEIISPTDMAVNIRTKREIYIEAGILYWEMYPNLRRVDVYAPGQPMHTAGMDGILNGGEVLPGFELPLKDIFPA
ncbi:MAG: Uma2 family endonuclease [Chloroflexi bacterium]|nr:Uma2 family endonuclease [Chloroflexota bacterium]MDL1883940.1 Uma2 family endonuclease [Anaerolineae bacterium CFX8]